ncbi:MAG TPA: hypothetical protein VIZ90_02645, partial [Rhizobiaceae bacterium]
SVADPELRAFGSKLRFSDDPAFPLDSARLLLRFADGREIERMVDAAKGGLARPMSDEDLAAKLAAQVEWRGLDIDADRLVAAIKGIEDAKDGTAFLALARPQ